MWLWLWILWTSLAWCADTSRGPVSPAEAEILWKDGTTSFESRHFNEALPALQRLVDRYPGYSGYLDAHLLLGKTFLGLGQPAKAIKPLKYYVAGVRNPDAAALGRIALGWALIQTSRFQEAYLTSLELEKNKAFVPQSLMLRARAQMGLKQLSNASLSLAAISSSTLNSTELPTEQLAESIEIEHELKNIHCASSPTGKAQLENEIIEAIEKRSQCMLEALLLFRKITQLKQLEPYARALKIAQGGWKKFYQICQTPPTPRYSDNKKRTALEEKRFKSELRIPLLKTFESTRKQALDFISGWLPSESAQSQTWLKELSTSISDLK